MGRWNAIRFLFLAALVHYPAVQAQQTRGNFAGEQAPVLVSQPDSPLQVVSMTARPSQGGPNQPNQPIGAPGAMADYDMVLRNTTSVPIMAYAIRHELQAATGRDVICQSSLGFTGRRIGAGETSTIEVHLQSSGPTTTPIVDLVVLSNGTYFGADRCGTLHDYVTRLAERRATLNTVMSLIRRDGVEKTTAWINAELERDVRPLLTPTKLK